MGKVSVKRVRKEGVSAQVFNQLKAQIIQGSWKPGDKLPSEGELSEMFGVSRVSIREALQRLATLGLLETRHGEGTYVRGLTAESYLNGLLPALVLEKCDIIDVLEYRLTMERGIMALAVEKATDEDIELLELQYKRMLDNINNSSEFAMADMDFHLCLAKATGNQVLFKVNSIIQDILLASMENIVQLLGTSDGIEYHRRILDALKSRESEKAQNLIEEHVRITIDRVRKEGLFS